MGRRTKSGVGRCKLQGTGQVPIGMAIATAANRLRSSEARSKVIILLTDGANNAGEIDPVTAARAASALGIKIYAIGVGSSQAAQLAGRGLSGAGPELDEDTLRQVAGDTGEYFRATDEKALREIYRQIDAMEKSEYLGARQTEYRQLYGRFVWPALALLTAPDQPLPLREGWLRSVIRPDTLHPHYSQITPAFSKEALQRGYRLNTWTVNDPDLLPHLWRRGVGMVCTDVPDALTAATGGTHHRGAEEEG